MVEALGVIKLSTMDPLEFPLAFYTRLANDVSNFSMLNVSGRGG